MVSGASADDRCFSRTLRVHVFAIPDGCYGPANPEVRRHYARIAALDPAAAFAAPRGDRSFAAACIDRWLHAVRELYAPSGAAMRSLHALGPEVVEMFEHLQRNSPKQPPPTSVAVEWAEGPFEILVAPELLASQDDCDCWGYYRGGLTWSGGQRMDLLRTMLLHGDPALQALVGPPLWRRHEPMLHTDLELRGFDLHACSARAVFALDMLGALVRGVVEDVLASALLYPRIHANPHEPELALIEHGLFPLGGDDHAHFIFRYNPEPVTVPAWLPYFAMPQ